MLMICFYKGASNHVGSHVGVATVDAYMSLELV